MRAIALRRRIGTACFAMMLAAAGAANARRVVESSGDATLPDWNVRAGARDGARLFGAATRAPEPWYRKTFVVVREDGTSEIKRVAVSSNARPAKPGPRVDAQPPGVVRNLRRTDQR